MLFFLVCTHTIEYRHMRSLSSREVEGNGPMKPGNPPVLAGRVPIPADYAFRKMRGLSKNAQPLKMQGFFMPFKTLPCSYPGIK
jgi:hypothetical protein